MTTILRVDASARKNRSLTRTLSDLFIESWRRADPVSRVIDRDVGLHPPSFITEDWIAAVFTEENELTSEQKALIGESDILINEIEQADIIVIATPMYNYGMPAHLKAWIDQVVRIGKAFTFDLARGDQPLSPILSGKTLVVLTSWGEFAFGRGEANECANHLTPHIETVSKYLGVDEIHHIGIEYQEFGDHRFSDSKAKALKATPELVTSLISRKKCLAA